MIQAADGVAAKQYPVPANLQEFIVDGSIVARSPGRINLIGEHTDYNNGFVLPAAIDKAAFIVITPRKDDQLLLHAVDLNEHYSTSIGQLQSSTELSWPNYILGVVAEFLKAGVPVRGLDASLTGDIPIGAGLSSSAAVECAVAVALNQLYHCGFDKLTLVKMSQRAENIFVGVQCGIMDQFASMFGKQNHAIRLDCRTLDFDYVPLSMEGIRIVLLDTNVKHSLGSSEYNVRRQQCETGVAWVKEFVPTVKSLRDVNMAMLDQYVLPRDPLIYQRCKYVVDENSRLLAACEDLSAGDLIAFGKKMYASHDGLSRMYEVSCPELDFLVAQVRENPDVLGARMMGGGFGGCTINLVKESAVSRLKEKLAPAYQRETGKQLTMHVAQIENGSCLL